MGPSRSVPPIGSSTLEVWIQEYRIRASAPTEQDRDKLRGMLQFFNVTKEFKLQLKVYEEVILFADACFAVRAGLSGIATTPNTGAIDVESTMRKLVATCSAESKLV